MTSINRMKVILVIDDPSSCWGCRLDHFHMCMGTRERKNNDGNVNKRPDWCPLKPMPSKMKINYDDISSSEVTEKVVAIGWNSCIDKIIGEQK